MAALMIPVPIDPRARDWRQPDPQNITIDETHALMTEMDFSRLIDYTGGIVPHPLFAGKMWKVRLTTFSWRLLWLDYQPGTEDLEPHSRKILVV